MTSRDWPSPSAEQLLRWMLDDPSAEIVLGDLREEYAERLERHGFRAVRVWHWWQVLTISGHWRLERARHDFTGMLGDLARAGRALRRAPAFTAVGVLTLALAIAAATATLTQIRAVFLSPPPVARPHELRMITWTSPARAFAEPRYQGAYWDARLASGDVIGTVPHAAYARLRDHARSFSNVGCWSARLQTLLREWGPMRVQRVTGNFLGTLGVAPLLGRAITAEDDRRNAAPVAVLGFALWHRAFGGESSALGRSLTIGDTSFQVIGVMPESFFGLDPLNVPDVLIPWMAGSAEPEGDSWGACNVVARVVPGASEIQAHEEAELALRRAVLDSPPVETYRMPQVVLADATRPFGDLRRSATLALALLGSTVGVMLLVVCANLAGLLLARGTAKRRELATRVALGASRARVVRQLLMESVLLSMMGGALGIALAYALSPLLPLMLARVTGYAAVAVDLSPDPRVLSGAIALAFGAGLGLGLWPALRSTRVQLLGTLRQAPTASGPLRLRFGQTLVALQVALSMVLLIGAALFARTLLNLVSVPVGYEPERLAFVLTENPPGRPRSFVDDVFQRIEALPGVASATVSQWPLFNHTTLTVPMCVPGSGPRDQDLDLAYAFPRFFETWGVPLMSGVDFEPGQRDVAIVNEEFARVFLAGGNPLGKTIGMGECPGRSQIPIIGVVADHIDRQRSELVPTAYVPYPQDGALYTTTYAVRTYGDPGALIGPIRRIVAESGVRVEDDYGDVVTGSEYYARTMKRERLLAGMLASFGGFALLICSIGVYGILSYVVRRRTTEIGIRKALGAERASVVSLVVGDSLLGVCGGIALGVVVALGLGHLVQSLLFGVSGYDPWAIAGAAAVFLLVASLAAGLPALRATRIDPTEAFRAE